MILIDRPLVPLKTHDMCTSCKHHPICSDWGIDSAQWYVDIGVAQHFLFLMAQISGIAQKWKVLPNKKVILVRCPISYLVYTYVMYPPLFPMASPHRPSQGQQRERRGTHQGGRDDDAGARQSEASAFCHCSGHEGRMATLVVEERIGKEVAEAVLSVE